MEPSLEIPYAEIQAMPDLAPDSTTEGYDGKGNFVTIQRYVSPSTHMMYECFFAAKAEPQCRQLGEDAKPPAQSK